MDPTKAQNIVIRSAIPKSTSKKQRSFPEGQRLQAAVDETRQRYLSLCRRFHASQFRGQEPTEDKIREIARTVSPVTLTVLEEVVKLVDQAYTATEEGQESEAETAIAVSDDLVEQTVQRTARLEAEFAASGGLK